MKVKLKVDYIMPQGKKFPKGTVVNLHWTTAKMLIMKKVAKKVGG